MVGRQTGDQSQLFYLVNIEGHSSVGHLLLRTTGHARATVAPSFTGRANWNAMSAHCYWHKADVPTR